MSGRNLGSCVASFQRQCTFSIIYIIYIYIHIVQSILLAICEDRTECVNTGFLGFRNSAASKRLLALWKQKTTWSMSLDPWVSWNNMKQHETTWKNVEQTQRMTHVMKKLNKPMLIDAATPSVFLSIQDLQLDDEICWCWWNRIEVAPKAGMNKRDLIWKEVEQDHNVNILKLFEWTLGTVIYHIYRKATRSSARFWDQNSFAESILELVGMEMEELGRPGKPGQTDFSRDVAQT